MERCDQLGTLSEEPGRLTRRFATDALREAGEAVLGWMREAGMSVRRDAIGNVVGRYEGAGQAAPTLLLGSHLDTVRDAGRYDGALGVVVALACVERLRDAGRRLPYAIEVIGFADEEGVRYGTAYLGSKVVAGTFDPDYLAREDADGVRMAEAIRAWGGDPERLSEERRDAGKHLAYCEVHMEQGPVLEADGLPLAVVSGIAGQTRVALSFEGTAGHAGTVPMQLRRDALVGAAEWVTAVDGLARGEEGLVATVGTLDVEPGASNVIPGRASLSLDVRHDEDERREAACRLLRERASTVAAARGLGLGWEVVQESRSVHCSPELSRLMTQAVADAGHPVREMPSGAGHDAAAVAAIAPVTMLFVRCAGGISHNPAESVEEEDVAVAIDVLGRFLTLLAER